MSNTLLIVTQFLQESLKEKYSSKFQRDFHPLSNAQLIANSLIDDFFNSLQLAGIKNIKSFCKAKLQKKLAGLPLKENFEVEKILELLDEFMINRILKSNN